MLHMQQSLIAEVRLNIMQRRRDRYTTRRSTDAYNDENSLIWQALLLLLIA